MDSDNTVIGNTPPSTSSSFPSLALNVHGDTQNHVIIFTAPCNAGFTPYPLMDTDLRNTELVTSVHTAFEEQDTNVIEGVSSYGRVSSSLDDAPFTFPFVVQGTTTSLSRISGVSSEESERLEAFTNGSPLPETTIELPIEVDNCATQPLERVAGVDCVINTCKNEKRMRKAKGCGTSSCPLLPKQAFCMQILMFDGSCMNQCYNVVGNWRQVRREGMNYLRRNVRSFSSTASTGYAADKSNSDVTFDLNDKDGRTSKKPLDLPVGPSEMQDTQVMPCPSVVETCTREPDVPVFGLWKFDNHYYPGALEPCERTDVHKVLFEDASSAFVSNSDLLIMNLPPLGTEIQADVHSDGFYVDHLEIVAHLPHKRACRLRNKCTGEECEIPRKRLRLTKTLAYFLNESQQVNDGWRCSTPPTSSSTSVLTDKPFLDNILGKIVRHRKRRTVLLTSTVDIKPSRKKFIRRCRSKSKSLRNTSLTSVCSSTSLPWLKGWCVMLTESVVVNSQREERSRLHLMVLNAGGDLLENVDAEVIAAKVASSDSDKIVCLAREPLRTAKYLASLASGSVICLDVRWLEESCSAGIFLPMETFRLDRGTDIDGTVVTWRQVQISNKPFRCQNILLATDRSKFWTEWPSILQLAGADKVTHLRSHEILALSQIELLDYTMVVCDDDMPLKAILHLKHCRAKPLLLEYLVQVIIQNKLLEPNDNVLYTV